ncbi:methyl-accepting chemotaxis protein [Marinilabilia salmonicolor]|uniref:methyl-accepting chemotaxis protein n=1 Tax=Marinilabilia salmonicolor TaxID=989 RepID=UPI00029B4DC0|nr:Cache 3/Cache 2 fusion domain-containing protein [Marinilabilia salmonicolor]
MARFFSNFRIRTKDLKISTRLNFILGGIIAFFMTILAVYSYFSLGNTIKESAAVTASDRLLFLEEMVLSHRENVESELDQSIKVVRYLFQTNIVSIEEDQVVSYEAINQMSGNSVSVELPIWYVDNEQLQNNSDFADYLSDLSGGTVTIFQKFEDGFLRVATSVFDESGNRATGTFISNESEVAQTIERGETFRGSAFVVDQSYLSVYEPLIVGGKLQGMLFVGVPESDFSGIENLVANLKTEQEELGYFNEKKEFLIAPQDSSGWNTLMDQLIHYQAQTGTTRELTSPDEWSGYIYLPEMNGYLTYRLNRDYIEGRVGELVFTVGGSVFTILAIILVFLFYQSRDISFGFRRAVSFATEMEKGDLTIQSHEDRKDEIGMLGASLNSMVNRLRIVVQGIEERARKINNAGNEMNKASVEMSEGANVQASASEEVSSSMEEMVGNIQQNSDNSLKARENAQKMTNEILNGVKMSKETRELMQKVSERIVAISDIARQTNILALNAAVEAARAGEHGRGFSVVAAEIRKLAERSRSDADIITALVEKSTNMSEETESRLSALEPELKGNLEAMDEITAASREMSLGAEQVNSAIMELNRITQQSAAISEQVSSGSSELSSLAAQMLEEISYFRVK